MQPAKFCRYPEGEEPLMSDELNIIWTEEGDGAALFAGKTLLANVPSWSGFGGFFGYARSAKGSGGFAWETGSQNQFVDRIAEAKDWGKLWNDEPTPWQVRQPEILARYDELFGASETYYAIDGGEFPPRGLYVRAGERRVVFATVGMSLFPQPQIEQHVDDATQVNRIELGMLLNAPLSSTAIQEIASSFSGVAGLPWNNIAFLAEGHTVNFSSLPRTDFNAVLFTNRLSEFPNVNLGDYRGSRVLFLWAVPITDRERSVIMEGGAEEVLAGLEGLGAGVFNIDRPAVVM